MSEPWWAPYEHAAHRQPTETPDNTLPDAPQPSSIWVAAYELAAAAWALTRKAIR